MAKKRRPWLGWIYLIAITIGLLSTVALVQRDARAAKERLQLAEHLCVAAHQQIDLISNWSLKRIQTEQQKKDLKPLDRLALERQLGSEWQFSQALRHSPTMRFERALSARRGAAIASILGRKAESRELNAECRQTMKSLIADNPTVESYYFVLLENYLAGVIQRQNNLQQAHDLISEAAELLDSDTFPRDALATRNLIDPLTQLTSFAQKLQSPTTPQLASRLQSVCSEMAPYGESDEQLQFQLDEAESILGEALSRS